MAPPDLADLSKRLDRLLTDAKPIRFTTQVAIGREDAYDVLDSLRASLPESIMELRWYQQQRQVQGEPPLGSSLEGPLDVLPAIDALDDLVHHARPMPLSDSVRIGRERLAAGIAAIQAWLEPFMKELADYRAQYPELRREVAEAREREPSELTKLVLELCGLLQAGKVIPLTAEKRLDRSAVAALTKRLRAVVFRDVIEAADLQAALDQIDELVKRAKPVPLTDQARVDGARVTGLVDQLLAALDKAEREPAT